jgi:hypothetical protein
MIFPFQLNFNQAASAAIAFHVPGVPADTQTQPGIPPAAGFSLKQISP